MPLHSKVAKKLFIIKRCQRKKAMKTCVSDNVHTFDSKCQRKESKTMLLKPYLVDIIGFKVLSILLHGISTCFYCLLPAICIFKNTFAISFFIALVNIQTAVEVLGFYNLPFVILRPIDIKKQLVWCENTILSTNSRFHLITQR